MKNILSFALVLILLMGTTSVSAMSISEKFDPNNEYKYEDIIIPKKFDKFQLESSELVIRYSECYEYYSDEKLSDCEEATPDYVLISLYTNSWTDMPVAEVFCDYVLHDFSGGYPFKFGYGIYIPSTGELHELSYAYKLGVEGIENVFNEAGVGDLIGDMDKDRVLTIKDATEIQKCLAGVSQFSNLDSILAFEFKDNPPLLYVSDFNRDGERNIKDATAIQKHIAGLEY